MGHEIRHADVCVPREDGFLAGLRGPALALFSAFHAVPALSLGTSLVGALLQARGGCFPPTEPAVGSAGTLLLGIRTEEGGVSGGFCERLGLGIDGLLAG